MSSNRLNMHLPEKLAQHVNTVVHSFKTHETSSEYVRDLIRRDMENENYRIYGQIREGFCDLAEGRAFESTGDFRKDMQLLGEREAEGWK